MKVKKVSGYSAGYPKKKGVFVKLGDAVRSLFHRRPERPQVMGRYLMNDPDQPEPRLEGEPPIDTTEPELMGDTAVETTAVETTEPKLTGDPKIDLSNSSSEPAVMGKFCIPPEEDGE